ncbi:hypothetical protein [Priestia megaterium]|uniref:hypothetical protein n=1 Tax=Priestia megaterium TaxID=1404 RepID=UPI00272F5F69|nr:hypothetical protein [Priestia megaterium]MDP1442241.1 hypothetical protein [Priestia megaterium]MDP1471169.1 hypothetical protein [Priestia megaterium]
MRTKQMQLQRIQHLAHEIMDKMNKDSDYPDFSTSKVVIDNLSRALGNLTDPFGNYSIEYVEEKVEKAYYLLFKNEKKLKTK